MLNQKYFLLFKNNIPVLLLVFLNFATFINNSSFYLFLLALYVYKNFFSSFSDVSKNEKYLLYATPIIFYLNKFLETISRNDLLFWDNQYLFMFFRCNKGLTENYVFLEKVKFGCKNLGFGFFTGLISADVNPWHASIFIFFVSTLFFSYLIYKVNIKNLYISILFVLSPAFRFLLFSLNPDIIFCFGWSSLIKKRILNIAHMGVVGYHPSKLPQNRGRHPLIWTLTLGLDKSASTFFFMDEGADSGDILSQIDFEVSYQDNARSLYDKVVAIALEQIERFIPQLESGDYPRYKQDDRLSNVWRKRGEPDGRIDFRMSSRSIYNLTRALSRPYVGAHIRYKGESIAIWKAQELDGLPQNIEPGRVVSVSRQSFVVKSSDGAIEVLEHDFKEMPKIGECL